MVAAEFGRLRERERFLDSELHAAQAQGEVRGPVDEEAMTQLLGEESVRVLTTARESANEIRAKAEQAAAQMLQEAGDEATRVREEADIEASRRRADAAADAESELSMAKQQGREMVNEARAYRERVLSELARRRELAREQIEQLIHGRDRLTQAFERARLVAVDVVAELQPLGEPNEYVNLTPTTGPLPVMIANSPRPGAIGGEVGALEAESESPAGTLTLPAGATGDLRIVDVDADAGEVVSVSSADAAHAGDEEAQAEDAAQGEAVVPVDDAAQVEVAASSEEDHDVEVAADIVTAVDGTDGQDGSIADVMETADSDLAGDESDDDAGDVVVDLFARLRSDTSSELVAEDRADVEDAADEDVALAEVLVAAESESTEEQIATDAEADAEAEADQGGEAELSAFEYRDEVVTPLIVSSAKKLKRALADEQNDVLDALRRSNAVQNLDVLLPWASEHSARYTEAIAEDVLKAVYEGSETSRTVNRRIRKGLATESVDVANEALMQWLVLPLRDRLERCIAEGEGDNAVVTKKVRAVYREWKTQRIDETLDDVMRSAHGRGVLAGFDLDTPIVWEVDTRFPACPDCDDNVLAGAVAAGSQFPTGDLFAPSHQGCRCLLVAADR